MLKGMKLPISLVVITLNEERHILRCLLSVPWASEVIIVDSGSHDRTVEIAQNAGAKVIQKEWMGFGKQKKFAVLQASYDWVICLDADEALSPELSAEIESRFSSLDSKIGYRIPRLSYFLRRWIHHGGWYPDYQLRLFNRKFSNWNDSEIHEKVISDHQDKLKFPIHHFVFSGIKENTETNIKYSHLQAANQFKNGARFSYLKLLIKPFTKFIECYFLKFGFLDGLAGFVIAIGAAHSVFLRIVRLRELDDNE
jgi:glycosyltransferase involved in cell wall biosynthesis